MKKILIIAAGCITNLVQAQAPDTTVKPQITDTTAKPQSAPAVQFNGLVETYFAYDLNKPANHEVSPPFLYNYRRHNEFNINMALLGASYSTEKIRARIGIMAGGTYAQYNYAAEQELLKHVYEANAGVRLAKHLWLDAGIFASHIGNESAASITNPTLTRSIMAENSPYYQTGAKLTFDAGKKWLFSLLVLNGWQNIQETPANSNKPVCTQITFRPGKNVEMNSSTFIGNEKPDTAQQWRFFHHFYITAHVSKKLYISACFDYGVQQKDTLKSAYNNWYATSVIAKCKFTPKFSASLRGEYYSDPKQIIVTTGSTDGIEVLGASLNLDYSPFENSLIRAEGRFFQSQHDVFLQGTSLSKQSVILTTSFIISF